MRYRFKYYGSNKYFIKTNSLCKCIRWKRFTLYVRTYFKKSRQIPVKKENVEDEEFFKKRKEIMKSRKPIEDRLIVQNIRNIFGDIIKENFPFYTNYETYFDNVVVGIYIHIWYYYMGKKEHYNSVVSLNKHLEENVKCFEDDLIDIKDDMVSYPDNEIQQKFLREC